MQYLSYPTLPVSNRRSSPSKATGFAPRPPVGEQRCVGGARGGTRRTRAASLCPGGGTLRGGGGPAGCAGRDRPPADGLPPRDSAGELLLGARVGEARVVSRRKRGWKSSADDPADASAGEGAPEEPDGTVEPGPELAEALREASEAQEGAAQAEPDAEAQLAELQDAHLRLQAEFENFRRRGQYLGSQTPGDPRYLILDGSYLRSRDIPRGY